MDKTLQVFIGFQVQSLTYLNTLVQPNFLLAIATHPTDFSNLLRLSTEQTTDTIKQEKQQRIKRLNLACTRTPCV